MTKLTRLLFLFFFFRLFLSHYLVFCNDDFDDILIYEDVDEDSDTEIDVDKIYLKSPHKEEPFHDKINEGGSSFIHRTWVGDNERLFYMKLIGFAIAFLLAVINGYVGRKKNKVIAINWFRCCQDIFDGNFAKLGNNKSFLLEKSYDSFEFFGTGRKNCNYYVVKLNLMVRQCIWRYYFLNYFTGHKDVMRIQINFAKLDKTVLCIYRKKKKKTVDKEFPFLLKYTKCMERKELKNVYAIRADSSEVVDLVLGGKILQFLNTYDEYINFICITDIPLSEAEAQQESKNKNNATASTADTISNSSTNGGDERSGNTEETETEEKETCFCYLDLVIPSDSEELRKFVSFSIFMIDACHSILLSDRVREHVKKLRALIENEDEKRKQEIKEMEERKKAKKLQQEQEKIENMTAQQQRKYEERKQKKMLKKNKKIKIIKM